VKDQFEAETSSPLMWTLRLSSFP